MKHHLRGEKLKSFLRFKYILEVTSAQQKLHLKDKNILSLIVIAGQLDSTKNLGNKIRHLKPEEAKHVINNVIPLGVDISKLTNSISNFKANPLTLDFVKGLFETNTNNYKKLSKEDQDYIRDNFLAQGLNQRSKTKSFKAVGERRSFSSIAKNISPSTALGRMS